MRMCPIDLDVCERAGCGGGTCELAGVSPLLLCWECGAVEAHAHGEGFCSVCLHPYTLAPAIGGA